MTHAFLSFFSKLRLYQRKNRIFDERKVVLLKFRITRALSQAISKEGCLLITKIAEERHNGEQGLHLSYCSAESFRQRRKWTQEHSTRLRKTVIEKCFALLEIFCKRQCTTLPMNFLRSKSNFCKNGIFYHRLDARFCRNETKRVVVIFIRGHRRIDLG